MDGGRSKKKNKTDFGLRCGAGEEFDAAKVVGRRHQVAGVRAAAGVDVGAVGALGPHAQRRERQRTRQRGPLDVAHLRRLRDLAAHARVPCGARHVITSTRSQTATRQLDNSVTHKKAARSRPNWSAGSCCWSTSPCASRNSSGPGQPINRHPRQ